MNAVIETTHWRYVNKKSQAFHIANKSYLWCSHNRVNRKQANLDDSLRDVILGWWITILVLLEILTGKIDKVGRMWIRGN